MNESNFKIKRRDEEGPIIPEEQPSGQVDAGERRSTAGSKTGKLRKWGTPAAILAAAFGIGHHIDEQNKKSRATTTEKNELRAKSETQRTVAGTVESKTAHGSQDKLIYIRVGDKKHPYWCKDQEEYDSFVEGEQVKVKYQSITGEVHQIGSLERK